MEPIREAEMQTQPGKRLNEESKKNGKVWKIVVGVVAAAVVVFFGACCILAHASTAFFPHHLPHSDRRFSPDSACCRQGSTCTVVI